MDIRDRDIAQFLPLRPRDYLILFSLVEEPRHGYGIIGHLEVETDGSVRLDPANLYRAIKRLSRQGLVEESDLRTEGAQGERRRYWAITELGRRTVAAEASRLDQLARLARSHGLIPRHDG